MPKFAHDAIVPDENSLQQKKHQVAGMFDQIAGRYDFLNGFLSIGIDKAWRKKAVDQLRASAPREILDVATGTGDMALLLWKRLRPQHVTGIDISEKMLAIGREKIRDKGLETSIELLSGDSERIKFSENSFDAVTVAFGVRNFEHLEQGLREMHRVLRPGGKLVVLEFSQPSLKIFRGLYRFYMGVVAPLIVQLFSKNKKAYQYLDKSARAFPEGAGFLNIMHEAGFTQTYLKTLSLGICTIYCGSK